MAFEPDGFWFSVYQQSYLDSLALTIENTEFTFAFPKPSSLFGVTLENVSDTTIVITESTNSVTQTYRLSGLNNPGVFDTLSFQVYHEFNGLYTEDYLSDLDWIFVDDGVYDFTLSVAGDNHDWEANSCDPLSINLSIWLDGCYVISWEFERQLVFEACVDPSACNYWDLPATCVQPSECDYWTCSGCADPFALNYDGATIDNGSCDYLWDDCDSIGSAFWQLEIYEPLFANFQASNLGYWRTDWGGLFSDFYPQITDSLALNQFWSDGPTWFPDIEPGTPVVLPFDSISVLVGQEVDKPLMLCVPEFVGEPLSNLPFGVENIAVTSVEGLPAGMVASFDVSALEPHSIVCISLTGESGESGIYPLKINCNVNVSLFGGLVFFEDFQVDYELHVLGGESQGCLDSLACNYGDEENGCLFLDECGDCGGPGIEEGSCDCDGNVLDALGVCGGDCFSDVDNDGVCDIDDDCIGELDSCGICGGDNTACMGCTYHEATNFNQASVVDDGSCVFDLGGSCQGDLNDDSVIGIDDILLMLPFTTPLAHSNSVIK